MIILGFYLSSEPVPETEQELSLPERAKESTTTLEGTLGKIPIQHNYIKSGFETDSEGEKR